MWLEATTLASTYVEYPLSIHTEESGHLFCEGPGVAGHVVSVTPAQLCCCST